MNSQRATITLVGVVGLLLAACSAGQAATPTASPYPTGEMISECFPTFIANAWLDANGDGRQNPDERPLNRVRVEIVIKDDPARPLFVGDTQGNGQAEIRGITTNCELTGYIARVTPPVGYKPAGSAELAMDGFKWDQQTLDFPLILDVTATPTGLGPQGDPATPSTTGTPEATGEGAATLATFNPCEALSRSQAEAILGPLDPEPQPDGAWGEPFGHFAVCFFQGAAMNAYLSYPDQPGGVSAVHEHSREAYTNDYGADKVEVVQGLGEDAFLVDLTEDSGQVMLNVLRGDLALSISVYGESGLREAAIQIAEIALIRIP